MIRSSCRAYGAQASRLLRRGVLASPDARLLAACPAGRDAGRMQARRLRSALLAALGINCRKNSRQPPSALRRFEKSLRELEEQPLDDLAGSLFLADLDRD